jgi:RNA polymerase sigma-70 factor (ECF subfamily)
MNALEHGAEVFSLPGAQVPLSMAFVQDDEALATAFAAKEPRAFEEAYRRYGSLLYSTAYHVLGNAEDAQDCVHDALARVWRSPGAYRRSRGSVRGFLTVCVRNEAITRLRSRTRRSNLSQRLWAEPQEHAQLEAADPIESERLQAALRALPDEQRRVIELAYFRHLTHAEIACELGDPLGTVKSRIAMALRKLGSALGERT